MRVRIGEVMINNGLLTKTQVEAILEHQRERPRPFGELAELLFHVSAEDVEAAWVEQYASITEHLDPGAQQVDETLLELLSRRQAWQFRMLPVRWDGSEVMVATVRDHLTRAMRFALRQVVQPCWFVLAEPEQLGEALMRHYPMPGMTARCVLAGAWAPHSEASSAADLESGSAS